MYESAKVYKGNNGSLKSNRLLMVKIGFHAFDVIVRTFILDKIVLY